MTKQPVEADERSIAVDNAAGNRAYQVMTWLLVIDVGIHGMRADLIDWTGFPFDLVAVIMGGGLTWLWHAWKNQIIPKSRLRTLVLSTVLGAVAAAAAALLFSR